MITELLSFEQTGQIIRLQRRRPTIIRSAIEDHALGLLVPDRMLALDFLDNAEQRVAGVADGVVPHCLLTFVFKTDVFVYLIQLGSERCFNIESAKKVEKRRVLCQVHRSPLTTIASQESCLQQAAPPGGKECQEVSLDLESTTICNEVKSRRYYAPSSPSQSMSIPPVSLADSVFP